MAENKVFGGVLRVLSERTKRQLEVQSSPLWIRLWISVGDRIINRTHHGLRAGAGVREGEHKEKGLRRDGRKMITQRDRLKPQPQKSILG